MDREVWDLRAVNNRIMGICKMCIEVNGVKRKVWVKVEAECAVPSLRRLLGLVFSSLFIFYSSVDIMACDCINSKDYP